jgi:hypothetical protein
MLLTERMGVGEDVRSIHLVVEQIEPIGRFLLGLGVQRLLESPELWWSCQAHANLPPLDSLSRTPNQGAFPPCRFCCPAGTSGTVRPSDAHRRFSVNRETRVATPRDDGPPVLRRALCRRATPLTPVSDPAVIGRLLMRDPTAFPVIRAGRRSRLPCRGLLRLHTCCSPSTCRPAQGGPMSRGLQQVSHPSRCLGSYWGEPTIPPGRTCTGKSTAPFHSAPHKAG